MTNPLWQEITNDLKKPAAPPFAAEVPAGGCSVHHARITSIMKSMDERYQGLAYPDSKGFSALTCWANGIGLKPNRCLRVIATTDDPDSTKPWRRLLAVTCDPGAALGALKNVNIEMLGICRDYPGQTTAAQWLANQATWFQDIKVAITGTLCGTNPVNVVAVVPPTMTWTPMQDLHQYMINSLRTSGAIISQLNCLDGFISYSLRIQA
jgi:hypothetical protein